MQSAALREAIKEYDANKWKVIGQKVGKPAKVSLDMTRLDPTTAESLEACEQYAKEHFKNI